MDDNQSFNHSAKKIFSQNIGFVLAGLCLVIIVAISVYWLVNRQSLVKKPTVPTSANVKPLSLPIVLVVPTPTPTTTPTQQALPTPTIKISPSPTITTSQPTTIKTVTKQPSFQVSISSKPTPIGLSFIPHAGTKTSWLHRYTPLVYAQDTPQYDAVVYYIKTKDNARQIFRYNLVTNEEFQLTNDQTPKHQLVVSPTYQAIAFVSTEEDSIDQNGWLNHIAPTTKIFNFSNKTEASLENFAPYSLSPDGIKLFGVKTTLPSGVYSPLEIIENNKRQLYKSQLTIYDLKNNAYTDLGIDSDSYSSGTWESNESLILIKDGQPNPTPGAPSFRKVVRYSTHDQNVNPTDLNIPDLKYPSRPIYLQGSLYYLHTDQLSSTSRDIVMGINLENGSRLAYNVDPNIERVLDFMPSSDGQIYAILVNGESRLVKITAKDRPLTIAKLANITSQILGWADDTKLLVTKTPEYPLTHEGAKLLHNQIFIYDIITGASRMIFENDLIQ